MRPHILAPSQPLHQDPLFYQFQQIKWVGLTSCNSSGPIICPTCSGPHHKSIPDFIKPLKNETCKSPKKPINKMRKWRGLNGRRGRDRCMPEDLQDFLAKKSGKARKGEINQSSSQRNPIYGLGEEKSNRQISAREKPNQTAFNGGMISRY